MSKQHIISRPTKISDLTFEDLYEEISDNWSVKAERLLARRRRNLKREIKGDLT